MLFNSLSFLLLFLPVALLGYYVVGLAGHKWAGAWLVFASFVFYTWWTAALAFLLAGSIAYNFTCGALILRSEGRDRLQSFLLALGIAGDLGLLFYFKYFFALLNWLGGHGVFTLDHPYSIVLPLGISFFTFTQIGYLIDCRGGVVKESRLLDYSLFVTFFPHLIAGPILHHREMIPQFANPATYRLRWENLAIGTTLFVIGLAKKVIFADNLIWNVGACFGAAHPGLLTAWDGALSYSLQLYFDFSGYSDMACGLALLFGIKFPANFNSPYRATSIIDYWQRFHMTLTRYITLYIYSPLALWVSRQRAARGMSINRSAMATPHGFLTMIAFPTILTMALAGIWHGAGLTFLIFGLLHAVYLIINHAWRTFGPRASTEPSHPAKKILITICEVALTYLAVVLAQVVFRAPSLHKAGDLLTGMAGLHGLGHYLGDGSHLVLMLALFIIVWTMPNSLQILDHVKPTLTAVKLNSPVIFQWRPTLPWTVAFVVVATAAFLSVTGTTEFLYFRF